MARDVTSYGMTPAQLSLVKTTVAADCDDAEFNLFMEAARSYGLDPFRKQIIPLVFSKNDPKKRRMTIVVPRDGLRLIAQRCGDYRPASERPEVVYDEAAKNPATNPKGLVSVSVRLWKADKKGEWYPVFGEALWEEFVPLVEEWAYDQRAGKRRPTGKKAVDGNWAKMPVLMLTKCAEAQALRAGWPDQFAGLYDETEMDQARAADMNASQILHAAEDQRRQDAVKMQHSILAVFNDGKLVRVPEGEFADRCMAHIARLSPDEVKAWQDASVEALREFWAVAPSDAHMLKQEIEKRIGAKAHV